MVVSIKKIMLLSVMVSCLGVLLYSMPETQVKPGQGNKIVQIQTEEIAKIDF